MLRKGYDARLIFDRKGKLMGFSTGSDACTEHECGSNAMQVALCPEFETQAAQVENLANALAQGLIQSSSDFKMKPLLQTKRIGATGLVNFDEYTQDGEPCAMIYFGANKDFAIRELGSFRGFRGTQECLGAWDEKSFAIAVSGAKNIKKLRNLFDRLQAGQCVFAGLFFEEPPVHHAGVLVVDSKSLRPEHKCAMYKKEFRMRNSIIGHSRDRIKSTESA